MRYSQNLLHQGTLLVLSGPSGSGKTTVCKRLLQNRENLHFSVSCTTRPPRRNETEGRDYYFLDDTAFDHKIQQGAFLEYARVHGHSYGTLRQEVEHYISRDMDVLLDIDTQGAAAVRERIRHTPLQDCTIQTFLGPPSLAEMEHRLRTRGTDDEGTILRRLENARAELSEWSKYDYLVINHTPEQAERDIAALLSASRCATSRYAAPPWASLHNDGQRSW